MSNENIEIVLKVILLGDCGVGKTNIILRFMKDQFDEDSITTTGSTYTMKVIEKDNIKYRLNIWDTAGQEKYRSITKLYLQDASIIILVYSIIEEESFNNLDYWYNTIKDKCSEDIVLAIVGNKSDLYLEETVKEEKGVKYAEEKNAIFKLISAKTDKPGIDELFRMVLEEYIKKTINEKNNKKESIIISNDSKNKEKVKEKKCNSCLIDKIIKNN